MQVRVAGHQVETSESLQSHVSERIEAIADKYFDRAIAANVTFGKGPYDDFTCEIVAPVPQGVVLKASNRAGEARVAFEGAADKIERQLSRYMKRLREHKGKRRLFDFEITLTAGDKDVVFGDTKEGAAAIRIAESMRLKGPKATPGAGKILNSEGQADGEVWGKRAKWVDMSGPIDGKIFGIAFMDHPKNPRHPTRWHARDYGLFAANPFCEKDMDKNQPQGAGDFTLKAWQSVTFRYRLLIHEGDAATAKVADEAVGVVNAGDDTDGGKLGLLGARQHPDRHIEDALGLGDEVGPILRLARGRGGDRLDPGDAHLVDKRTEPAQRSERAGHGIGTETAGGGQRPSEAAQNLFIE